MKLLRYMLIVSFFLTTGIVIVFSLMVPYLWMALLVIAIAILSKKTYAYTAYGTSRFANIQDLPHLLKGTGVIIGHMGGRITRLEGIKSLFDKRVPDRTAVEKCILSFWRKQPANLVRLTNAVHTAVFAPTGVGKGVSIVIPHLLSCRDSMVVIDPKGENFQLTAHERKRMGQVVVRLDPFGMCGPGNSFNPLQFIDSESPTAIDEIRDLAEAMVMKTGSEQDPHWNASAELWITGMMAAVVAFAEGKDKNLQSVRALLTNTAKMQGAIELMCRSDMWDGLLARIGGQLAQFKDKELNSVLTTSNRNLNFLDTIPVINNTKVSDFNPTILLKGQMTIYLIIPPEHQRTQAPLLRLWITSMLRTVVRGGLSNRRVHFILDEAASLGRLEVLDDAVDKYRSYGVRLLFLYQSLGQLKKCFPEGQEQTLLSNTTQVFFRVNDYPTAEYVSNRLGDFTQVVTSGGTNTSQSSQSSQQGSDTQSYSWGSSNNWQQAARRLLQPPEVTALDPRVAITFHPGVPPIATWLVRYYEKNFMTENGIGVLRAAFETLCLFLSVCALAVMVTVRMFPK